MWYTYDHYPLPAWHIVSSCAINTCIFDLILIQLDKTCNLDFNDIGLDTIAGVAAQQASITACNKYPPPPSPSHTQTQAHTSPMCVNWAGPCNNSAFQARITEFGSEVQNKLVRISVSWNLFLLPNWASPHNNPSPIETSYMMGALTPTIPQPGLFHIPNPLHILI